MSLRRLWRKNPRSNYPEPMGVARQGDPLPPVRHLSALDGYEGMWVAVKAGEVVASAPSSRELVLRLKDMGASGKGAVAQYVPKPTESFMVGVG
jgi:hypothetical protein